MEEMKKNNSLMSGKGEGGKWITVNSSHIFIEDGQSVEDAMNKHFSKSGDPKNDNKAVNTAPKKELSTSQQMKSKLKEAGIDTKNISIRQRNGAYSSAYYLTVKSPYVDIETVRSKIKNFESYERDQRTGEILEGGNTYVFASYDDNAFDEVAKEYIPQAQKFLNEAKNLQEGYGVSIQNGASLVKDGNNYQLFNDTKNGGAYTTRIYDEEQLAKCLFQLKQFKKII